MEFLRGRYDRVEVWLAQAEDVAGEPAQRAAALTVRGSALSDRARYAAASDVLREALGLARDDRRRAYVLSMVGRVHLLRGEHGPATTALDESTARAAGAGWTAFIPWPEALRAGVALELGNLDAARTGFEHAFALGCQVGDPCWEGLSARGLGLVLAAEGNHRGAIATLLDARRRSARLPDGYLWVEAYVLDALATVGTESGLADTRTWIAALEAISQRCGMTELMVRAAVHRWRLGDPAGREAATVLGPAVDNPILADLVGHRYRPDPGR